MRRSIGYKFLLGILFATTSFLGLEFVDANIARITVLTLVVAIANLTTTAVFEASFYTILTLIGALLALKYKKKIYPTPNNQ